MGESGEILASFCKSAITQARQRLSPRVMSQLFHQLVRPMASTDTKGAFLNGLRIVVIDRTCFDLPDSDENARVFGRPSSRPGTQAAFPKLRLVILVEAGTHLIFDALMCPYRIGETSAGIKIITLREFRDVVDVGQRVTFLCNGASNCHNW
ncbi:MAG: hypothetical protein N4J56_000903 [Chroococcidiopsis sp. SAG 2025]|nr:hypothetical protein [Chroococcidiopsis sp. SAG 2025]